MTDLVKRIEAYLDGRGEIATTRFLSGEGVFLDDKLVAAVIGGDLCVRVGVERWERPDLGSGVRQFHFADKPVPGWVTVDAASLSTVEELSAWLETAL